jgi:biopolymer transport protein TolR
MGMSGGSGDKKAVQSEINVTPLIDVLLVLLIIFLVVMPIMMKMETLEIPRKLEDNQTVDEKAVMITITLNPGGSVVFNENSAASGEKETQLNIADLLSTLRPKLENWTSPGEKVVFVHFHNDIEWKDVISTMDSIRSLATDVNHDEIKVALKIKEDPADAAKQ